VAFSQQQPHCEKGVAQFKIASYEIQGDNQKMADGKNLFKSLGKLCADY